MTHSMRSLDPVLKETLRSVLDRLLPADEFGPGAVDAGVLDFIDSELRGRLSFNAPAYAAGLRALDEFAVRTRGTGFTGLPATDQDAVLKDIESAASADHVDRALRDWFRLVLDDCLDGYLSDPVHGGNRDAAGWKVVGYPGPSFVWSEDEQELDRAVPFRGSSVVTLTLTRRKPNV